MRRHIALFLRDRSIHIAHAADCRLLQTQHRLFASLGRVHLPSRSLTRVVTASLGVSLLIMLGCGKSPSEPSPAAPFSVLSISPTEGSSAGGAGVVIGGIGFHAGATVIVDGSRVDATVLNPNAISLEMPAHAAGKVEVTVIDPLRRAQASVPGGYTYVAIPIPPPVISELLPNIGSTGGGTPIFIKGTGFRSGLTVSIGGIVSPFQWMEWGEGVFLSTPAHAAGTAEVIVSNPDGQTGSAWFTYASPATFDFNGDWQGWAHDLAAPPGAAHEFARLGLTIRDNIVVSVSCSLCRPGENCATASHPSVTLDPPPVVANGEFSFAGSGGSISGKILSPNYASGSINMASCGSRQWWAETK
jgi:hypothetical protein